jgi:hypothetical protein
VTAASHSTMQRTTSNAVTPNYPPTTVSPPSTSTLPIDQTTLVNCQGHEQPKTKPATSTWTHRLVLLLPAASFHVGGRCHRADRCCCRRCASCSCARKGSRLHALPRAELHKCVPSVNTRCQKSKKLQKENNPVTHRTYSTVVVTKKR